jgi:hypothetical protein
VEERRFGLNWSSSILSRNETGDPLGGLRKRIIVGGAQVGQVAIGAISEADRHNIRGEHISVDTIPLVGEQVLADAVRAVGRLSRASTGGCSRPLTLTGGGRIFERPALTLLFLITGHCVRSRQGPNMQPDNTAHHPSP